MDIEKNGESTEELINLGDIVIKFKRNFILFISTMAVVIVLGLIYIFGMTTSKYISTGTLIVSVQKTVDANQSVDYDYAISEKIVKAAAEIVKEDIILQPVADKYNMNIIEIRDNMTVYSSTNSYLIKVSYISTSNEESKIIATEIVNSLLKQSNDGTISMFKDAFTLTTAPAQGVYHSPNKILLTVVTLFISAVVGVGVVFIKEVIYNKFRTKKEIEAYLNKNVIGVLFDDKKKLNSDESRIITDRINLEQLNKAYVNLKYSSFDKENKVIQITSSSMSELKSTISTNLALTISRVGLKVLIIDLDFRRPVMHKVFGLERLSGISELLSGEITLEQAIKHTKNNVDVLTSGTKVLDSLPLLQSHALEDLIKDLRDVYDYIIIDSPPVLVSSDAAVISKLADKIVYNVACNQNTKTKILEAFRSLESISKEKIVGVIVTKLKFENKKEETYYYYYDEEPTI